MGSNENVQTEDAYLSRVSAANLQPVWRMPGPGNPEPIIPEVPFVWRWDEVMGLLHEAGESVVGVDSGRRALNAKNPALPFGATRTMSAGYQLVLPGEVALTHRHSPAAIRFIVQGGNGHTVVDGEPVLMEDGDLVLTPGSTWHDHRVQGDQPLVWLDGLDAPFVKDLGATFFEDFPDGDLQPITKPEAAGTGRFGAGVLPAGEQSAGLNSPMTVYKWRDTWAALQEMAAYGVSDPLHGTRLEYINPVTGGHVLPTLACYLQLLKSGISTTSFKQTSSTIFCVVKGSGHTIVNGERLDWGERDFFVVPAWSWHEHHVENGSEDAVLFALSDLPIFEPFGLYRQQVAS
ncbi:cupin domain-containing protein [Rhodococcus sp. T2V]|uniref:cupin domain-containing protein n=1 Tax=Rhodococcus sp. T2V TaxID=3034164 RepID=UPI0023E10EE1|nr:cupin domain-containing protein [Rhodococcus sp. T2V]MDF3311083.1 cupin domain-containing protein [Rhodococcus sp. T2V]